MKVAYCSDLHLEFRDLELNNDGNADVLILAGDIYPIYNMKHDLSGTFYDFMDDITGKFKHIIYVAGNHEYYHSNINDIKLLRGYVSKYPNVHVLDTQLIMIDNITFVGGTMWTDMNKDDPIIKMKAPYAMNDFRVIEDYTPDYSVAAFKVFNDYLKAHKPADVVITHHGPSWECLADDYRSQLYNPLYVSEVDVSDVKYWVYGHLHGGKSFEQDGCQILHNPRGYPSEKCFREFTLKYFYVD